jgi:hypothetical protein
MPWEKLLYNLLWKMFLHYGCILDINSINLLWLKLNFFLFLIKDLRFFSFDFIIEKRRDNSFVIRKFLDFAFFYDRLIKLDSRSRVVPRSLWLFYASAGMQTRFLKHVIHRRINKLIILEVIHILIIFDLVVSFFIFFASFLIFSV